MVQQSPDDDALDRCLARGGPAGPQLDRMWNRLAPSVVPARKACWLKTWWKVLVPVVPVAACLVLWLQPSEFVARGGDEVRVHLESSCGPCAAGSPVFLRVTARDDGVVYVLAVEPDRTWLMAGPMVAQADAPVPVPVAVVPEQAEKGNHIQLKAVWMAAPMTTGDGDVATQLMNVVQTKQVSAQHVATVEVEIAP